MAMVGVVSGSLYRRTHSLSRLAWSWVGGCLAPFYIHGRIQKYGLGGREGVGSRPLPYHRLPPCRPHPSLPLPFLSPPLRSRLLIQLEVWESAVRSPTGSGAEPQPKLNLVHFSLKIWHLVATILIIFPESQLTKFQTFMPGNLH